MAVWWPSVPSAAVDITHVREALIQIIAQFTGVFSHIQFTFEVIFSGILYFLSC